MKIKVTKTDLLTGVNTVQRAVSAKNTLPILQGIKLRAENNTLCFEATDLELGIRSSFDAEIIEEGTIVLPSRLFSEIVRKLPDSDVVLESTDHITNINYSGSSFTINGYDPEEFPEIGDVPVEDEIKLPADLFKNMIRQTVFACAAEETRPVFTGLLLHLEEDNLALVGTDTHRLAYRTAKIPGNKQKFKGIVPAKSMQEIYRLLQDDHDLTIYCSKSRVFFNFGSIQLQARLIDGQFPNYKQVIPQKCNTKLLINTKNFTDMVERASLLSKDNLIKTGSVRINVENSVLKINQFSEAGKINEEMKINQDGEDVSISFNSKYVLDLLKIIDSENILMETSGAVNPCIFRPENDQDYLCLVLPLRN
ncbi:DNA polymerase III, beta subunit [Syntrophobotulus glycolicus DSM 8271]|uniref:Beta sliding clamp n=1 Tax=Syntrophobotulus glycolicus (strain DSM 8271 / FlGlyR) TaxID=645991 RepID=F0SUH0_SYNGF|nr:DNA polymerase III subunit beta [Syntrophobotulus glycolicus]ADY54383.1 DNA polymerase III, beta subunit [Syntrophobotulus glycolicus DSM 8271]